MYTHAEMIYEWNPIGNTFQIGVLDEYTPEPFVDKILDSPPVPKHNLHYCNRDRVFLSHSQKCVFFG